MQGAAMESEGMDINILDRAWKSRNAAATPQFDGNRSKKWARLDLNQGPRDYESPALTAELRARPVAPISVQFPACHRNKKCIHPLWGRHRLKG